MLTLLSRWFLCLLVFLQACGFSPDSDQNSSQLRDETQNPAQTPNFEMGNQRRLGMQQIFQYPTPIKGPTTAAGLVTSHWATDGGPKFDILGRVLLGTDFLKRKPTDFLLDQFQIDIFRPQNEVGTVKGRILYWQAGPNANSVWRAHPVKSQAGTTLQGTAYDTGLDIEAKVRPNFPHQTQFVDLLTSSRRAKILGDKETYVLFLDSRFPATDAKHYRVVVKLKPLAQLFSSPFVYEDLGSVRRFGPAQTTLPTTAQAILLNPDVKNEGGVFNGFQNQTHSFKLGADETIHYTLRSFGTLSSKPPPDIVPFGHYAPQTLTFETKLNSARTIRLYAFRVYAQKDQQAPVYTGPISLGNATLGTDGKTTVDLSWLESTEARDWTNRTQNPHYYLQIIANVDGQNFSLGFVNLGSLQKHVITSGISFPF